MSHQAHTRPQKASSDHLVRAWLRTYGLPTLVTNFVQTITAHTTFLKN